MQEHLLTFEQQWSDETSGRTLPKFVTEELHKYMDCGQVVRIFADTVAGWYRRRHADRGLPPGQTGAVTVIQRANSDLRLNPHLHTIFLDGVYSPDGDGKGQMFHPAPAPTQQEVEQVVERASKRILRFLQRRGVITLVTAPGDGEVTVVTDDTIGEKDPLLAKLLAAATAGMPPAGTANKRKPVRIVLDPNDQPIAKGKLCAQEHGFNLHGATRVAANDMQGRLTLCKYILRPPLASRVGSRPALPAANHRGKVWKPSQGFHVDDRLKILDDQTVRLDFKKPWSDGTACLDLAPLALIARLAALIPPPKRHTVRYFGVLSSHATSRSDVVPSPAPADSKGKPKNTSKYISWSELLRRTFGIEILCTKCKSQLRLIALIKTEDLAKKILKAMHLPSDVPQLRPARPPRPPRPPTGDTGRSDDWLN